MDKPHCRRFKFCGNTCQEISPGNFLVLCKSCNEDKLKKQKAAKQRRKGEWVTALVPPPKPNIATPFKMKPMIIIAPGLMEEKDIEELRNNGICVATAKDPEALRFVDPIPAITSRTEMEDAAIRLSRKLLNPGAWNSQTWTSSDGDMRKEITAMYVDMLVKGTPLDSRPTQQELERESYDQEKIEECRRIAREDARAEAAARKAKEK